MRTACPTCGAEVEFRYDDSFVRVCGHCRAAVVRTDRGVESLGQVADLAPSSSPLSLFLEGSMPLPTAPGAPPRRLGFMLIGRAQIQHGAGGVWEEWYAKFDDGRWGWLAEAQGRFYISFETLGAGHVPSFGGLAPGARLILDDEGPREYVVAEKGEGKYLACEGEIPYRFVPGAHFLFADIGDGQGRFGTIDYGEEPTAPPSVYLGRQVTLAELGWDKLEAAMRAAPAIASGRLACPNCDGSIELRAPGFTERLACPYCDTLLDVGQGSLRLLGPQARGGARPLVPLGTKATFFGVTYTLIGFIRRYALSGFERYPFDEYLLYEPTVGYRWLVESDGHWSFVTTLPPGAVAGSPADPTVAYHDRRFAEFQRCPLEVGAVHGEVYWRVEAGETVYGTDYIAPPAMLSCEEGPNEVNWSLGVYVEPAEVRKAFGDAAPELPAPEGIAPNQPFRHKRLTAVTLAGVLGVLVIGLLTAFASDGRLVTKTSFDVGRAPTWIESATDAPRPTTPGGAEIFFSEPFELKSRENVEITLAAPSLDNEWMAIGGDLINEETGLFEMFDVDLQYWSGVDYDGSWSEGSRRAKINLGAVPAGSYVLRLEVTRGKGSAAQALSPRNLYVEIHQDVFRFSHFLLALGVIGVPGLLFGAWQWSFERRRWRNSDLTGEGDDDDDDE